LSSLIYPADVYNKVMKSTNSSFLSLNLETKFVASSTKLRFKLTNIYTEDNYPDNKVNNIVDIT